MWPLTLKFKGAEYPDSFWRSLHYFNLYRLGLAAVFTLIGATFGPSLASFGNLNPPLFLGASIFYLALGVVYLFNIRTRRPPFTAQLALQVFTDVAFAVVIMGTSGGIGSGVGLLLLSSLAAAGLVSRGRLTLFFASIASIGVLLEETYGVLYREGNPTQYIQTGLLCVGYFAVAWLAHKLAKYAIASEQLAVQRGIDLANLAEANQLVIQDMLDGVLVVDTDGRVRQRNTQADRLLGAELSLPAGVMLNFYHPELGRRWENWKRQPRGSAFDVMQVAATGRLIRPRFVPIAANVGATLIYLEDMGRIQAQAQQLKLAALGRLTANIAHEIRNPLSAISHAAELLQEGENGPENERLLHIIRDNAQRLDRMVQDVLLLNRRDRTHDETIVAAKYLRNFTEEFCQAEKIPAPTFMLESGAERSIAFDRVHLNQVLWNLCRNAWRHCQKRPGSIRLRVSAAGYSQVMVDVVNDGPGVAPELQGQLFEPFFTTLSSGTGLGLYIARELCEANGAGLEYVPAQAGAQFRIICRGA